MIDENKNCRQNSDFMDVVAQIKNYLLHSPELVGGSRIVESTIAKELNCGRAAVREAIKYLTSFGLLEIIPNKGAHIAELTPEEIRETFELRILLESALIEKVILNDLLSEDDFIFLENCVKEMTLASSNVKDIHKSIQTIVECDLAFHHHIWCIAGMPIFSSSLEAIHTKLSISMYKDYYMRMPHLLEDVTMHFDIITYLRKGHVAMAIKMLRAHVGIYYL